MIGGVRLKYNLQTFNGYNYVLIYVQSPSELATVNVNSNSYCSSSSIMSESLEPESLLTNESDSLSES